MTIKEIVKKWLKKNGYDGLSNPRIDCGCGFNSFMPCDCWHENNCIAGHKEPLDSSCSEIGYFPGKKRRKKSK